MPVDATQRVQLLKICAFHILVEIPLVETWRWENNIKMDEPDYLSIVTGLWAERQGFDFRQEQRRDFCFSPPRPSPL
jgi:hypothetical protein